MPEIARLAVACPVCVLGLAAAIATIFGALAVNNSDWNKTLLNRGPMSPMGVLMAMIMERGFFRGWLWAALKRSGRSDTQILIATSRAFVAWHVFAVTLDTGFDLPANETPIYLINRIILGLIWGVMRMVSGSIVVPAVSRGGFPALLWRQYAA